MRTLLLLGVLLLCGIGTADAAPPEIGTAIRAERVVMKLTPGKVTRGATAFAFSKGDKVGVAAYVNGREIPSVGDGGKRLELAGRGAYVVVNMWRDAPATMRAVALRKMRLVVYLEWESR